MNLLRATVKSTNEWWQITLLDLRVVADGETEDAMLRELEYALIAEYHLALKFGHVPFFNILKAVPTAQSEAWVDGDKNFRGLNLPQEVRVALSAAFRLPSISEFQTGPMAA